MIKDIHTAAFTMLNAQTRLEVAANNIANASTPAFKREVVFERNLIDSKASLHNNPGKIERQDAPIGSYLDWTAGEYNYTNNPFDVAIEGAGFFVCKNADGAKSLTRCGAFGLNSEGYIVTRDGKFVAGVDEDAILIPDYAVINDGDNANDKTAVEVVITKTGEVLANDVQVGKLLLIDCEDYSQLQRISKQEFVPNYDVGLHMINDDALNIKQGWLESSNVSVIEEMITMIELQRVYEVGSKIIQTSDTTLERSIGTARFGYY